MKRKVMALVLTAAMGAMSAMPVMAAQNSANYDSSCYKCGGGATTATVVGHYLEDIDARICEHGHAGEADVLRAYYERVNYYCADCDVNWEENEFAGMAWHCTYDD